MFKLLVGLCLVSCCLAAIGRQSKFGSSAGKPKLTPKPVHHAKPAPPAPVARPPGGQGVIGIRSQVNDVQPDGSYVFSYETENGDKFEESGALKTVADTQVIGVGGSYSYTGDDGQVYSVSYTADENGFRPVGDHIPEIPEYIARSLVYIAEHPYVEK